MPKVSFAQEMAEMERVVAATRVHAEILPPLAQSAADQLESLIAQAKAVKVQQQSYLAAQMEATERFLAAVEHGNWLARRVRARVVLALGTKHAQLAQFGIRIRRRPRRKTAQAPAAVRPARADVQNAGATIVEIGGSEHSGGGNAPSGWAAVARGRGEAAPQREAITSRRGDAAPSRGDAAENRAAVPSPRGNAATSGAAVSPTTRRHRRHPSRTTSSRRRR